MSWFTEKRRAWLYRILTAAVPVVVGYGLLTETEAAGWLGIALAVLGTGTATVNTSTKTDTE